MNYDWHERYANRMKGMSSSAIRELLKLSQQPDVISFAGGLPAPELFPLEAFERATQRVLQTEGKIALQYGTTEGYEPLREFIVSKMGRYGINVTTDNILITSGSQQALDILGKIFIESGDRIITEQPTYLGAIQAWRSYQAQFVSVSTDQEGIRTSELTELVATQPKFMYILPNFQNPSGVTLPLGRRWEIVTLADSNDIPIIEDDPYGELRFEGEHEPPLVVLDARKLKSVNKNGRSLTQGNVIYLSTFSKTLAPGLRLGWMVAPKEVIQRCVMAKQGMDLHTSTFVQHVAYELIKDGFLKNHIQHIRQVYRKRRDVMLNAMETYFPMEVEWTRPQGGLFLWVTLPPQMDASLILETAVANKVAFVPGAAFYPHNQVHNCFRLNFTNAKPVHIEEGIKRLGKVLAFENQKFADFSYA